jgi:mono/diheme cytochrome c family protein/dipeptidyl aminopeptidase/acylaminoacyl peptidase
VRIVASNLILPVCAFLSMICATEGEDAAQPVSFIREVAPILVAKCQACHGAKKAESNYRLDSFNALMQPGDFGTPPVTAGDLENSEFVRLITAEDDQERMPNNGSRLAESEIKIIANWIEQGAQFDGPDTAAPLSTQVPPDIPHPAAPTTYPTAVPITAIAFTADGRQLVVGGYHELLIWDVASGKLAARIGNTPQRIFGMEFSRDHRWLAVAGGSPGVSGEVRLIPWNDGPTKDSQPRVLARHDDVFFDVTFRWDSGQLAACGADGSVRAFDVSTGAERLKITNHADWVTAISFSPDGTLIATASRDKTAKVFEAASGSLLATYSEHDAPVRAVAFSADGKSVISAGGNRIRVWNVDDSKQVGEMAGFDNDTHALMFQGETVVAAAADRTVRQFKFADRALVRSLTEHPAPVLSLAGRVPSHLVAAGCFDGTVIVWNLNDGAKVIQFLAVPATQPK